MAEKVKIKFLRGTIAQVTSATNEAGKPYFATDTKEVFISDGTTKFLIGKAIVGVISSRPLSSVVGRVFVATDENNTLYVDTGTAWVKAGITNLSELAGDLDDIDDGTTYGKVANTELNSSKVKQLEAETSGSPVTGDSVESHLDDDTKHRVINDSTPSPTGLYSSQYVKALIDSVLSDQVRRTKVINYILASAIPPSENEGDRYIIDDSTPHANWDGAGSNDLVEFVSGSWLVKVDGSDPTKEGVIVLSDAENLDRMLVNDGIPTWETRPVAIVNHNDMGNLNAGDYKHLTAIEYTKATVNAGNGNGSGLMPDTDKTKLDGIEGGAEVNQSIATQNGIKRSDSNGATEDAIIEPDYGINSEVSETAIVGTGSIGDSGKMAHSNHVHVLTEVDGGTL